MTTLIDASELLTGAEAGDQEPVVVAARSIEKLVKEQLGEEASKQFERDFMSLKKAENWVQLFSLMLKNEKVVFARLGAVVASGDEQAARMLERMAEGYLTVVIFLLEKFETEESVTKAVTEFCASIARRVEEDPLCSKVRLRALMILHNVFRPGTPFRTSVLSVIDKFAAQSANLRPFLKAHSVLRTEKTGEASSNHEASPEVAKKIDALVALVNTHASKGAVPLKDISSVSHQAIDTAARAIRAGLINAEIDQVQQLLVLNSGEVSPKKVAAQPVDAAAFAALLQKLSH
jgi:hypothetical protein